MEDARCPLCGGEPGAVVVAAGDRLASGSGGPHDTSTGRQPDDGAPTRGSENDRSATVFTVVRCRSCGLAFTSPRPAADEIGSFYPQGYNGDERAAGALARLEDAYRRRQQIEVVRWLAARRPGAGSSSTSAVVAGDLLLALRERRVARVRHRAVRRRAPTSPDTRSRRRHGPLRGCRASGALFDAIVFSAVLEHIADPVGALRRRAIAADTRRSRRRVCTCR